MNISELKAKTSELILSGIGKSVYTQSEIANAKALYEEVMASVPQDKVQYITPGYTGTIDSKREYIANHWMWKNEDASRQEFMLYSELASSIAHMLDGTLGLRD